jgi:hypothetical protein
MSWFKKTKPAHAKLGDDTEPHICEEDIPPSSEHTFVFRSDSYGIYIIQDNFTTIEFSLYRNRQLFERILIKKGYVARSTIQRLEDSLYEGVIESADGQNFHVAGMSYMDAENFFSFMYAKMEVLHPRVQIQQPIVEKPADKIKQPEKKKKKLKMKKPVMQKSAYPSLVDLQQNNPIRYQTLPQSLQPQRQEKLPPPPVLQPPPFIPVQALPVQTPPPYTKQNLIDLNDLHFPETPKTALPQYRQEYRQEDNTGRQLLFN